MKEERYQAYVLSLVSGGSFSHTDYTSSIRDRLIALGWQKELDMEEDYRYPDLNFAKHKLVNKPQLLTEKGSSFSSPLDHH